MITLVCRPFGIICYNKGACLSLSYVYPLFCYEYLWTSKDKDKILMDNNKAVIGERIEPSHLNTGLIQRLDSEVIVQ